jgi:PAS domain S-box-containing protein
LVKVKGSPVRPAIRVPADEPAWITPAEILESIGDAFYAVDRQWRFVYVNRTAERIWGKRREELLGQSIAVAFPAWVGSESHAAHRKVMESGEPLSVETVSAVLGFPVEINIFPHANGLSVYFRDASPRKRMEKELRERDEILSLAEHSAGIGIWDMDMATELVRGTPQFFRIVGLEPTDGQVPMERLRALRHPEDRGHVAGNFQRALDAGEDQYEAEYRIIRTDGEVRWIFRRGRLIRDAAGKAIRYSGVDIDVTDRKRTEQALRDSEERYRTLIENANDLVFTFDLDLRITSANPAVQRLLGYAPEELIGTPLGRYVPQKQLAKHETMLQRKLSGEAAETRYEMEVIDRTGKVRTLETNSRLSFDRAGRPDSIHAIARDVTERKRYEEHLALTTRELSHRTKNILAVVQAMVHQLGKQTGNFVEFERRLAGCVAALAHCHDLLVDSDWQGADLRDLLARQLAPFGLEDNRILAAGPTISLGPQATQLIGLALHELATNAAKHGALTRPAGTVAIEWQFVEPGDAIRLTWKEQNGPPVSPPTHRGFGRTVLERMAASLDGKVSLEFPPDGLRWSLLVDAAHIVRP